MAEQNQDNEEYHYDDLGTYEPEFNQENKTPDIETTKTARNSVFENPVIRNSLIVIVVVVVLMAGYKIYGWFSGNKTTKNVQVTKPSVKPVEKPLETTLPKIETAQPQPVQPKPLHPEVEQKLSNLETNQQSIQSNITVVEGQMSNVSSTVTQLNQKIESLTQTIDALNQKIDRQTKELDVINERTKIIPKPEPKPIIHHVKYKPPAPLPVYYIQAIIPGRAWLIGQNGATISIRNGSHVPGYGIVKLIDPKQGRIVTSSGRVMRFSPADS